MWLWNRLAATELVGRPTEAKAATAHVERAFCRGRVRRTPTTWIALCFVVAVCCAVTLAAESCPGSADEAVSRQCQCSLDHRNKPWTYALVDRPPFPQQPILHRLLAEHGIVCATTTLAARTVMKEKNNNFMLSVVVKLFTETVSKIVDPKTDGSLREFLLLTMS